MNFLMGRFEKSANEFYSEYVDNNKLFENEPIKYMSRMTKNILRSVNYDDIEKKRTSNFIYLHNAFAGINKLNLSIPDGPFMYPLYIDAGRNVREKMRKRKIYIPTLWPNVLQQCGENTREYQYAEKILPLPIDQRYEKDDMKYIVDSIMTIML